jgi:nucleoside-diphosphate kinase
VEQTLVVLKPDAVQRGIAGEIITRFERAGLKIVAMKLVWPGEEHFHKHYEGIGKLISRRGEDIFNVTLAAMTESPVLAFVLEGIDAVEHVRKMVGATDPKDSAPGTIRGDFTHISRAYAIANDMTLPNIIHASADLDEAKQEIPLWFDASELHDYEHPQARTIHGRKP